jgi:tetratricopeptide (TPR) repeat protein
MRMLVEKYGDLNDQQAVVRIYRKILELQPDSTQDIEQLLTILRSSGSKEDERQLLVSLVAADGQQVRYKLALVNFYLHYGLFAEAEEAIREGLEQGTGYFDFSRYLIDLYKKTNRYKEAIQFAKDVLDRIDKEEDLDLQIEFMTILAWLYFGSNNMQMAKEVVQWVLDLDGGYISARFLLARISLAEGRNLMAISELRALVSEDAANPEYDYYTGLAHMERDEKSSAEQVFKEALRKDPSYKPALMRIFELYYEKGFFTDLQRITEEFLTISPNDPDVLALQAKLASKIDDVSEGG